MKYTYIILFYANFIFNHTLIANDSNWQNEWRDRALKIIDALEDFSDRESALKVIKYAAIGAEKDIKHLLPARADATLAASNKLRNIPGHDIFFKREIYQLREDNRENTNINYNQDRRIIFNAMRQLKNLGVVKLSIEFLDDDSDFKSYSMGMPDTLGNDSLAASTLMGMIDDLPLEKDRWGYYRQDIPALQAWGREVLEGKRTFRFKDEPGVYNIHGRIREERREPSLPPLPATSGQDGMAGEKDASSPGVRWATLAALLVLLAVAARVFFFSRRSV